MENPITIIAAIIFAIVFMVIALKNKFSNTHLLGEVERLKVKLTEAENEKEILEKKIAQVTNNRGISESTVLALAGEMVRMENNLYHMEDVSGRKQVLKALDRMKAALQAEGYTVVSLLGKQYREGMQMSVVFVLDESLPPGSNVITSVQRPQVNWNGQMIQSASVTVVN